MCARWLSRARGGRTAGERRTVRAASRLGCGSVPDHYGSRLGYGYKSTSYRHLGNACQLFRVEPWSHGVHTSNPDVLSIPISKMASVKAANNITIEPVVQYVDKELDKASNRDKGAKGNRGMVVADHFQLWPSPYQLNCECSHTEQQPWPPPTQAGDIGCQVALRRVLGSSSKCSQGDLMPVTPPRPLTIGKLHNSRSRSAGNTTEAVQSIIESHAISLHCRISKSMCIALNFVESWLQNTAKKLCNGQLLNLSVGIHFDDRKISTTLFFAELLEHPIIYFQVYLTAFHCVHSNKILRPWIIARAANEKQNRKVKRCGYDSIVGFDGNNPIDASIAVKVSIDVIGTWTDSETLYA